MIEDKGRTSGVSGVLEQARPSPPHRRVLHVDMDAFYASVEQRNNPELRGKPVAVSGSAARGVIAAASYEARAFGVQSALPSVTAKRLCPQLIFVKPRFDVYRAVSARIRQIFAEHTDLIEPPSFLPSGAAGKAGGWYYRIARGIDDCLLQPDRPRKSVGAEDTFAADIFELGPAKVELVPLAAKVWRYCMDRKILGKTITLKVEYADFQTITRSRTIHGPVRDEKELLDAAVALLEATFPTPKGIRLLGITLSSLLTESGEDEPPLSFPL